MEKLWSGTPLFLAPLAGYTDRPFRQVVKEFGCDITFSEMVNVNAIVYQNPKTLKMLEKSPKETPYFVQIASNNLENTRKAVEFLNQLEWVDGIDINFGCPVKKAIRSGFGGVLLKKENLPFFKELIKEVVNRSQKPVSIKMRLGFGVGEFVAVERAKIAEDLGVKFITLHGRYVKQMYRGEADYYKIGEVVRSVSIPVIANGDITDYRKYREAMEITGAEGVAIGRGAVGKPWIFLELRQKGEVGPEQKREVILSHFRAMVEFYGERGVILFRKHLHSYSKGSPNGSRFRSLVNQATSIEEVENLIRKELQL